mmetsp:Transcript_67582/g.149734  ORF Transcript_67582/g.149734 Transcript_67582/m.149734 type:complete len:230 (+) Transcript_67582:318-1007(+)
MGVKPKMDPAREARTCWECSRGIVNLSMASIKVSRKSLVGLKAETSAIRAAAMVRTSTSWSESCFRKSGTIAVFTPAWKTSHNCFTFSAMIYLTRHDLSSAQAFTMGRICPCHSAPLLSFPNAMQLPIARIRTESCSSFASFSKISMSSLSMRSSVKTSAMLPKTLAAWRRTMGVSSPQSLKYVLSKSSCWADPTLGNAAAKRVQEEIRDVNQSCEASRPMRAQRWRVT